MTEPLTNGIYFKQTDSKEDGYYTKNEKGELIKHKYEKPSFLQKSKFFVKNGYHLNTETRGTTFYYFNDYYKLESVFNGFYVGDAISTSFIN